MNSYEQDNTIENTPIRIITRLRGQPSTNSIVGSVSPGIKTSLTVKPSTSPSFSRTRGKSREQSKSPQPQQKKPLAQGGVNESTKYTMFTSKPPANTLIISSKPIIGKNINDTFKSTGDLYEFSRSIMKETSILEFDRIYSEATKLDAIYQENIKDSISNLFHGKSSCYLFFGPIDGGKSYTLRGGVEQSNPEPGLLSRAVVDVFNLVDLSRQANQNTKANGFFVVKLSVYQVYLDNVHDLIAKETRQLRIEKYYDENNLQTNLIGLTQKEIKSKSEYDTWIKEAVHQRKTLSQILKVNELKRKSHLVISIALEKRERTSDGIIKSNERSVENYSQIDFVELASSNFGLMNSEEDDMSQNGILYRNTSKVFNSLANNIISIQSNMTPKNETKLSLCLKKTLKPRSKIVFLCCAIPWEFPHGHSVKAIKFANWLRNQLGNPHENQDCLLPSNDMNQNHYKNRNINASLSNDNSNTMPVNLNNPQYDEAYQMNQRGYNTINTSKPFQEDRSNVRYSQQYQSKQFDQLKKSAENSKDQIDHHNQHSAKMSNSFTRNEGLMRSSQCNTVTHTQENYRNPNKSHISPIRSSLINQCDSPMQDIKNYSSNEENELKAIRDKARRKYQSVEMQPQHHQRSSSSIPNNHSINRMNISAMDNNGINDNTTSPNINNLKLQSLEQSLRNLEEKNNEMNQCLENLRLERSRMDDSQYQLYPNKYSAFNIQNEVEIEKFRTEHSTLKSDNIIFREDINRLTDLNRHLEEELQKQRNRNMELAAENERLVQEKMVMNKDLEKTNEAISKHKIQEQNIVESFNQRMVIETKLKETENDFNRLREEKQRYEIDYKVLKERYDELKRKYTEMDSDVLSTKNRHNDEVVKIEEKIDIMTREIDSLQKENGTLRTNDERQRMDISSLEKQRDNYRDKYQEQKQKNNLLTTKLAEIEDDFKKLLLERESEEHSKQKDEETKKVKLDSKAKIVGELQSKIANYRTERLRKKQENN